MRTLFVLILLSVGLGSVGRAEKIKWYSWTEGYELAIKEGKPVLMFVQAPWCNMCKRLNEKTYGNVEVAEIITKNFIPVKYDVEVDLKAEKGYTYDGKDISGKELLIKFLPGNELRIPLTIIWTPGSEQKKDIQGIVDPEEMKQILNEQLKN
jgi:uncharacterized protein YyaL (SSP411 family)